VSWPWLAKLALNASKCSDHVRFRAGILFCRKAQPVPSSFKFSSPCSLSRLLWSNLRMPGVNALPEAPHSSKLPLIPLSESIAFDRQPIIIANPNGSVRSYDSMIVAEIKEKARDSVQREARGVSALTLIKTARNQSLNARTLEEKGDLKNALDAVTKSAKLAQMFMDSAEFVAEKQHGKHGMLYREFNDFILVWKFNVSVVVHQMNSESSRMTEVTSREGQLLWSPS